MPVLHFAATEGKIWPLPMLQLALVCPEAVVITKASCVSRPSVKTPRAVGRLGDCVQITSFLPGLPPGFHLPHHIGDLVQTSTFTAYPELQTTWTCEVEVAPWPPPLLKGPIREQFSAPTYSQLPYSSPSNPVTSCVANDKTAAHRLGNMHIC